MSAVEVRNALGKEISLKQPSKARHWLRDSVAGHPRSIFSQDWNLFLKLQLGLQLGEIPSSSPSSVRPAAVVVSSAAGYFVRRCTVALANACLHGSAPSHSSLSPYSLRRPISGCVPLGVRTRLRACHKIHLPS